MPDFVMNILPIGIIIAVIALVVWRLPKVEIQHTPEFVRRRNLNWIFLGLTYAFLYFGRYNLAVARTVLDTEGILTNEIYGQIYSIGSIVYGCSVVLNAPLCDKFGGRKTLMIGAIGAAIANLFMALYLFNYEGLKDTLSITAAFIPLYALNMYFQSFGAISIVKVNSAWFHVRERGMIGGIFGALISLGLYFAYDWNGLIVRNLSVPFAFLIPSMVLFVMFLVTIFIIRDSPKKAGFEDFNTGDATSGDTGPQLSVFQVFKKIITNPIILTIACIEFCSGYIRDGIMQWGQTAGKVIEGHQTDFIFNNWGMVSCCAGILAGMLAGIISDYVFKSRRGPVATILYSGLLVFCVVLFYVLDNVLFGVTFACMCLCVIGVHGMLSGTASMDFGGSKNAGMATGIIDGFAYLGSAASAYMLGRNLPSVARDGVEFASNPDNWIIWPELLLPAIVVGLILCTRIWNAKVQPKKKEAEPQVDEKVEAAEMPEENEAEVEKPEEEEKPEKTEEDKAKDEKDEKDDGKLKDDVETLSPEELEELYKDLKK
ncbi:MAG: MFS transporter [Proteobacteria bacterium]|nr:MFS transporter [Pseudomonadota bacterium]